MMICSEDRHCVLCDSSCSSYIEVVPVKELEKTKEEISKTTNADRIRAMSDEELVVFIDALTANCVDCESEEVHNNCPIHSIGLGRYCGPEDIMKWLRQPAEGEHYGV